MAVTKDPTGKAAPSGGFQTGGWYSGYQYWNGSFAPSAGQIHPESNQQGAGQAVSTEVNKASSITAGESPNAYQDWINKQNATTAANVKPPTNAEQVTPYLNNYQASVYQAQTTPEARMTELKTELAPTTAKPETLNRVAEFEKMRTEQGVADLEKSLTDLKAQQDELYAARRQQKTEERGKAVAQGVIEGRIGQEERDYLERVDYLGRQVARTTDELNTKYNVINTYMNYKGLDYQDAVSAYDKEFTQNMQIYDLIVSERKEARSEYEYDQTAAKANLQIYMNAITAGNMNYSDLSTTDKLAIQKLEIQAGFPVGTMANLKMSPKDKIISYSEDKTQALILDENGQFKTISTGLQPSVGSVTDAKATRQQFTDMATLKSGNNFPDLVEKFANTMSLEEIYQAYANSEMGKEYGTPTESPQIIKIVYKVARGEMTEEEAREELGI